MALIGWWPLDGSTEDYTVNKNNGVPTNVTYVNGKIGQAGSFNGSSSNIVIPLLSFAGEFSYALWINTSNTTDTRMFFGGNLSTSSSIKYGFLGGNFFIRVISSNQQVTIPNISNTWTHFVIRRNSDNKIDLFINGVGQRLFSDGAQAGTTFLNVIGNVSDGSGQWFLGSLNDVRIYNHALSQKEINDLVKAKVLHYTFNKDESIVYDNSGYKRNGTKVNSPTFVEGKLGSGSYRFADISKYIQSPYGLGINPSINPYTFSIWIKITSTANQMFFHTPNGSSQRFYIGIDSGKWDMGIQGVAWGTGVTTAVNNQWSHIVITMSGGFARMYVNGVFSFQKTYTSYTFPDNLRIGSRSDYIASDSLDDVRIYATALSDADILDLYKTRAKIDNQGNLYANEFVEDYEVAPGLTLTQLFNNYNIIANGDFSLGSSGWVLQPFTSIQDNKLIVDTSDTSVQQDEYISRSPSVSVISGKTYHARLDFTLRRYRTATVTIVNYLGGGNSTIPAPIWSADQIDKKQELSLNIGISATSNDIRFGKVFNSEVDARFEIDNIHIIDLSQAVVDGYFASIPTQAQMDSWYRDYSRSRTKQNGQVISAELSETDSPDQPMKIFKDKIQIQGEIKEV
jgi:hypothetical protein